SFAAAYAASQPAWPAPITITSKDSFICDSGSLPYTKPAEDMRQDILRRPLSGDFLKSAACGLKIGEHKFLGQPSFGIDGRPRSAKRALSAFDKRDVTDVGHCGTLPCDLDVKSLRNPTPQLLQPFPSHGGNVHCVRTCPRRVQVGFGRDNKSFVINI